MTSSDSSPKLPIWIFLVSYVALLAAAIFIGSTAARPLSTTATVSIVGCILAAVIVLLVPVIARYERQKNETLDERQRAIEALASTVSSSAEQISIAANGLNEIAELVQKNLRHAEQLPHKLQDKIAEFQSQVASIDDAEKEELEKELVALRSSESERLEAVATKIGKAASELAKLEAATQQHLAGANETVAKLSMSSAAAIGKAQAAAEQALAQARIEAARNLGETAGNAMRALETAKAAAFAELDAKLAAAVPAFVEQVTRALSSKLPPPGPAAETAIGAPVVAETSAPADTAAATSPKSDGAAQPPKRPRKMRRDDAEETTPLEPAPAAVPVEPAPTAAAEPPPIPTEKIPEISPVAPHTAQPFQAPPEEASPPPAATTPPPAIAEETSSAASGASPSPAPADMPSEPKIPRRRGAKKESDPAADEPSLDLGLQETSAANGAPEKNLTSDGATRLLVTAYIGIGNRLFIRGAGPGLSWEKGVPLQFVSIGKWRWESNDVTAPVEFKLFKNDDVECTALGAQTVDPGYQQEVTAAF